MIHKKTLVLILSFVFSSGTSYADGPGWTEYSEVEEIAAVVNGGVNIRLSPELSDCQPLSGYSQNYASVYPDHPGLSLFQSNLLAAMMSGQQVRLYLTDSTCKVTEMRVYKQPN